MNYYSFKMNAEKAGMEHLYHKRNGQWKNPLTRKRPMAVSRVKLSMGVTPYSRMKYFFMQPG